ncbi:aldehyde dehydrogenase family protein, partial [Pontibacterium sp.]|uniref:aldehyde dehydrogenase family protein n=1 Tax=Pontibacterium sp. TaxID=2036026 RepID=UPI003563AB43
GADFFDNPEQPGRLALDEPPARAAVRWFLDLQRTHRVAPDIVAETTQTSEDRFLNGGMGMFMSSRVSVPALRTITAFEWDAAPLPGGDNPASVLHSDGFCMSSLAARDEAHAIELANQTRFGLGASVWTQDVEKGEAILRQLDVGAGFVNAQVASDIRMPFGGTKASGLGRELGVNGIREFCNSKSVWIA